jgi:MoaA/NifB/PqqE/SkfB family radical SAM enzyme
VHHAGEQARHGIHVQTQWLEEGIRMAALSAVAAALRTFASNPALLRVSPSIDLFMLRYMMKFRPVKVGDHLILHSHLPPLTSKAYSRFVNEHLLTRTAGPSHAQIGVTNVCPQNCVYCYNKRRTGTRMDTALIKEVIRDLKDLGVFWLGLTGGEPLMNPDLVTITESAGDDCAVKLFTTGCGLTRELASDLRNAGLFSVSVSLDHWKREEHDRARRTRGAFDAALRAIEIFRNLGTIHVGVSSVLSKAMLHDDSVERLLEFLTTLEIHEAWLSETKPSLEGPWSPDQVITGDERNRLIALQDRYNQNGRMTVNYLGHFESKEHFGCSAGNKMIYVDAFGQVSPCVFTPISMGSVHDRSVKDIVREMRPLFPTESRCFINTHFEQIRQRHRNAAPLSHSETLAMLREVRFGPMSGFYRLYYH